MACHPERPPIQIIDGSFGSQLNKYVKKSVDGDPLWSARALVRDPEAVIKVHMDYIRAGCDIIETNTYQASIPGFMQYLNYNEEESYDLIKKAVFLAKIAVERSRSEGFLPHDKQIKIAGSVGSYGAYLHDGSEYTGDYTDNTLSFHLREYHRPRLAALVEGGVDLFALETIPSKKEAEILVELIKDYANIKAWLSFSCKPDTTETVHGEDIKRAVDSCLKLNPDQLIGVGVNCIAPHAVKNILTEIQGYPLVVYANSGEKYDPETGWDNNKEKLEEYIPTWLDLGVRYIGGCCRICPNYIQKIIAEVRKWEQKTNGPIKSTQTKTKK